MNFFDRAANALFPHKHRLRRLEARVVGLTADIDHKDGVIAELTADVRALNEQVDRRDTTIRDLRTQIERLNETMCGMAVLTTDAEAERDRITADRETVRRKLSGEAVELRQEIQTLKGHRDDAIKEAARLRKMLRAAEMAIDELAAANSALREVNEALRNPPRGERAINMGARLTDHKIILDVGA